MPSTEKNARFIGPAQPLCGYAGILPQTSLTATGASYTSDISAIPRYLSVSTTDCLEDIRAPSSPTSSHSSIVAHFLSGIGAHLNNGDYPDNHLALLGSAVEDTGDIKEEVGDSDSIDLEVVCALDMELSDII